MNNTEKLAQKYDLANDLYIENQELKQQLEKGKAQYDNVCEANVRYAQTVKELNEQCNKLTFTNSQLEKDNRDKDIAIKQLHGRIARLQGNQSQKNADKFTCKEKSKLVNALEVMFLETIFNAIITEILEEEDENEK